MKIPKNLDWVSVSSSNIARVAWADGKLYVEFHHGGIYSYSNVGSTLFHKLTTASSVGHYFAVHIRDKFSTTKLK